MSVATSPIDVAEMKTICVFLAVLALALAEPTIYLREQFEDGK